MKADYSEMESLVFDLASQFDGKTVLVTGASGLIGSNLVARLGKRKRVHVIALGRSRDRIENVLNAFNCGSNVEAMAFDIRETLPDEIGPIDYIFHAGSPTSGISIREDPTAVIDANIIGTTNCLKFLVKQKEITGRVGTFAIMSSASVYGMAVDRDRVVVESDTTNAEPIEDPHSTYSESKRMVEVIALAYWRRYDIPIKIARFSFVSGFSPNPPKTIFYELIRKAIRGEDFVFEKTGFEQRDNIFVEDAITGLFTICKNGESGVAYNVSSAGEGGNLAAVDEIASLIARIANEQEGKNIKIKIAPFAKRMAATILNNARLKALGWNTVTPLEQWVYKVYEMYKTIM